MTGEFTYIIASVSIGWMGIVGSRKGLVQILLPRSSAHEVESLIKQRFVALTHANGEYNNLCVRLQQYFSGQRVEFPDVLDLSGAAEFQRRVWQATRAISYGTTKSYLWLARQIGNPQAARAVGRALGNNPLPIILPCHRVVTARGALGGFSGGLAMKKYLLNLEVCPSLIR